MRSVTGEVCIFNVLYQIDVFFVRDDGIKTEAACNAIKDTVVFRRVFAVFLCTG